MGQDQYTLYPPYEFQVENPKEETVVDYLLNQAARQCQLGNGDTKWIANPETGEFCTFGQIEPLSRNVASGLYKLGMRRGDILLYSSHHPTHLHVFFIGCWRANGAVRAVYPEESALKIVDVILECQAKWFLCDPSTVTEVNAAIKRVPWTVEVIVFDQVVEGCISTTDLFNDDGKSCPKLEVGAKDMALILATSGTTGASKGCVHNHAGFIGMLSSCSLVGDYGPGLSLILGRQTHLTGHCIPLAYLRDGKQLLMLSNVTKENIFQAVHTCRPHLVFGFPKYCLYLANDPDAKNFDFTSLRYVLTGGVVITPVFISTMEALPNVRVVTAYGMSEGGLFTSTKIANYKSSNKEIWPNIPDFSVGKLIPGVMLQVRDPETGQPLGPNQQGELCFKSEVICEGYLKKPEETEKAFPNRWLRTGDMGYFDDNGFIFLIDRLKEIFKYFNNHISPSELENVIQRHPAVDNVCVVGVPDPDGGDMIPRAFVTLKDSKALASDIKTFANNNLASYQHLRGGLIVLNELPLGKSGKFNTTALKQIQIA